MIRAPAGSQFGIFLPDRAALGSRISTDLWLDRAALGSWISTDFWLFFQRSDHRPKKISCALIGATCTAAARSLPNRNIPHVPSVVCGRAHLRVHAAASWRERVAANGPFVPGAEQTPKSFPAGGVKRGSASFQHRAELGSAKK